MRITFDSVAVGLTKRRRREARLDKRFKPKIAERRLPGVKNTIFGKTPKK
jgi:hypothetical protein